MDKNWDEVTSRVTILTLKLADREQSSKGQAEVANEYITFTIYYFLTVVLCPNHRLITLDYIIFRFLWKGRTSMAK